MSDNTEMTRAAALTRAWMVWYSTRDMGRFRDAFGFKSHVCRRGRIWWKRAPRTKSIYSDLTLTQTVPPPGYGLSVTRSCQGCGAP